MESRIHAGRVCYRDDACDWIIAGPHAAVIRLRRISRLRATERPKNFDISPITAGPTRKPRKPTVRCACQKTAGKTADAPECLERRHDRASIALLDDHRLGVNADVDAPFGRAKQKRRENKQD